MTSSFLSAWLLFPLVLLTISAGAGMLVRRLSGGAVSGVLLLPVGFALTISVCTLATSLSWTAPAAGPIAVVVALAGIIVDRQSLKRPRFALRSAFAYPTIAAIVAFGVIAAPVVFTGSPTWTGYGRIVDIAFQWAFSQHLADAGRTMPVGHSSFDGTVAGMVPKGYPGGAQATLGAIAMLIRTDLAWCYQAFLACAAAMGALAIYSLLRRAISNPLLCCIGAAVAIQPNILYGYALEGGIKEITTAGMILLVAAIVADRLPGSASMRSGLALAPALAAAVAAFSYGILPWVGLLLAAAVVLSLVSREVRGRALGTWGVTGLATAALAVPSVISGVQLFGTAREAVTGVIEVGLGNLAAPVPETSAFGVWISNDYRFPQFAHAGVSHDFDLLVIVLASFGVLYALWRKLWMIAVLGVTAPIGLAYYVSHSGPWVELKAYTLTATMFLTVAFIGSGALTSLRGRFAWPLRLAGWSAAAALAGAVIYGNALTYHDISLAPASRYRQLASIGKRFAGIGPAFYPAFDEYSEYFLRRESGFDLVRPPALKIRPGAVNLPSGQFAFSLDLNQLELSSVESFPLIVLARGPLTSRPPANYDLVDRTAEFEVWRRVRPPTAVAIHYPLSGAPEERSSAFCRGLVGFAERAGAGAKVAYAVSGLRSSFDPTLAQHPSYWHQLGPETLRAYGAGAIQGTISLPRPGAYDVWMPGSVGRPLTLYVDGHRASTVAYQEHYPGQYVHFARVMLSAGPHAIRLSRPNGDLHPGDGDGPAPDSGTIGPLIFLLDSAENGRLKTVPAKQANRICVAHMGYQWIEVLKGRPVQ